MTQEEETASAEETAVEPSAKPESKPGPSAEEGGPVFPGGGVVDSRRSNMLWCICNEINPIRAEGVGFKMCVIQ